MSSNLTAGIEEHGFFALVAQWLAHLPSKQGVAGSSPAKGKLGAAIYYATE